MGAMTKLLYMDYETKSSVDIGDCGAFKYAESPDFRPLLLAYAFDDEPVQLWDFTISDGWPKDFLSALRDPSVTKIAWNSSFERIVTRRALGYDSPPEEWTDPMVIAAVCGLPMSLDGAGKALGLPTDQAKMKEGKALIRHWCVPTKDGYFRDPAKFPEKWETFRAYCRQDVEAERTIYNMLKRWTPDATERRFWCLDQRINENGINTDPQLVRNAMAFDARYKAELTEKAIAITGLSNPNSTAQVKHWLEEQEDITVPSLNKKQIAEVVARLKSDASKQFMEIRAELSKSSTKKYEAIMRSAGDDNHVRGCFQFYGASRTGRFAGRLVQLQNLPQNHMEDLADAREIVKLGDYESLYAIYGDVSRVLSELIRTALIPEDGHRFIVADYSAIEARVTAWLANETWRLEAFQNGEDIYCASASQMFGVPVVKHGVNGELRQKGKVAELALGYGGGPNAMLAFGADKLGMTDEEIAETVALWRERSPRIVALWRKLEKAAIRCAVTGRAVSAGVKNVKFEMENGILWMTLPSGRRISYYGARYEDGTGKFNRGQKVLSYMGKDQKTGKWTRIETWGGKLVENCFGAGTPVLTADGWTRIERVHCRDLLWDGVEWVTCGGKVCKGLRTTIGLNGVRVTPEHRILTRKGWKRAETCNGLYGTPIQLPRSYWPFEEDGRPWKTFLANPVYCLWEGEGHRHSDSDESAEEKRANLMRMSEAGIPRGGENDARNVEASGLGGMAQHEAKMHGANAPGMEELRRPRNHRLRAVAEQLRELLGGYGTNVSVRTRAGSKGQQQGVLTGELPMGVEEDKQPKPQDKQTGGISSRSDDCGGTFRKIRHRSYNAVVSTERWCGGRIAIDPTERDEQVYDIRNAGPRHRFTIMTMNGPLIVHNCVQATARDCLRDAMLALNAAGYDIRAHVHDEVIITEPIGGRSVQDVCTIMGAPLDWAPGLPLRADGYETPFYMKD